MTIQNLRIAQKLPLLVITASFVLGLGLGLLSFFQSSSTVDLEVDKKLQVVLQARKSALSDYLDSIKEDLAITASNLMVIDALNDFSEGWDALGEQPILALQKSYITDNRFPTGEKEKLDYAEDGSLYSRFHKRYHPWFRKMLYTNEYYDVFLFNMDGDLVYSVFKELDFATSLTAGKWKESGLGEVFRGALGTLKTDHQFFVDFKPYAPSADAPASFIAMPVFDGETPIGVLAYQMPISRINTLMQDSTGLGETGESYIVGSDYLMRSDSRFSKTSTILARKVDTPAAREALAGKTGSMIAQDYRNIPVKSAYGAMNFMGTTWAILAEIDEAEYVQPIIALRNNLALVGFVLLLIVGATGVYFARGIVKSLINITGSAKNLASGDFQSKIPMGDRSDEIGDLARAIQIFQDNALEMSKLEAERLRQQDLEETRQEEERLKLEKQLIVAAENMRIRVALDNCAANIMVVDTQGLVVYLNHSVENLMKSSEADIRQDIPSFSTEDIQGKLLNNIFGSAAKNGSVISNLKSASETRLKLSGRTFDLVSSPVIDDTGEILGAAVEWKDRTQELSVQEEIDVLVNAVVSGDFTQSVSLEDKEGFMRKLAEAMNQLNTTVSSVISDVANALSALSKGNLTHQITQDYDGTYDALKEDSNQTSEQLREIVGKIIFSATKINGSATEITSGSADLSKRTEAQAANLQQTASVMEELSTTVRQNAENAQQANKLAIAAHQVAENGGDVVSKSIEAMSEIEQSSSKVSEIISVIDEIAFQTNLLALNASVEAARAGDAGKGFAVVAAEVGTLAQRTATAAKDVKSLITNSDNQIKGGVELTNNTGAALKEIVNSIKDVTDIIGEITVASEEQARGIQETNTSIADMDSMTQQNAALVQQSLSSAEALKSESLSMSELVEFFDLEGRGKRRA
ncbi:MAG: methyl-accepting chemotaxis protein [Sneathiella sp.]